MTAAEIECCLREVGYRSGTLRYERGAWTLTALSGGGDHVHAAGATLEAAVLAVVERLGVTWAPRLEMGGEGMHPTGEMTTAGGE